MVSKSIAIIPARQNSKGVEGKNFKIFNGKPLVLWTIEFVKSLTFIDYAVISSDSERIRKISQDNNFNFMFTCDFVKLTVAVTSFAVTLLV